MNAASGSGSIASVELTRESVCSPSGVNLICHIATPEAPIKGGMVFVHGLGDHCLRHQPVWSALCSRGIAIVGIDFPGHGASEGKRGHIDSLEEVHGIIDLGIERLQQLTGDAPIGIGAHSMGGLLTLDYLVAGGGKMIHWLWLSSTLINPAHKQPRWKLWLADKLKRLLPRLTVHNGIRSRELYAPEDRPDGSPDPRRIGTHRRISMQLGAELLCASESVAAGRTDLLKNQSLLVTHGTADRVCPHQFARELFDVVESPDKEFISLKDGLHEPCHEPEFASQVASWIARRCE